MYAGPAPGTEAVFSEPHAGLPAAPPATGGSPPVGRPFCAIASEVPPAKSAATIVRVFKVLMFVLPNATPLTHVRRGKDVHPANSIYPWSKPVSRRLQFPVANVSHVT